MKNRNVEGYAGDIGSIEAWKILKTHENSIMIDVRTSAEWNYVGMVDLSSLGKEVSQIEWKMFPNMTINPNFIEQVNKICTNTDVKIFSLCRSGQRSISTSKALTHAGFKECYNVLEGFEGDKDDHGHRGHRGGWKFHGLPWKQN